MVLEPFLRVLQVSEGFAGGLGVGLLRVQGRDFVSVAACPAIESTRSPDMQLVILRVEAMST